MEALSWMFFILLCGGIAFLLISLRGTKNELPAVEELNKLTKAKLIILATENGLEVNTKASKKAIVEELNTQR